MCWPGLLNACASSGVISATVGSPAATKRGSKSLPFCNSRCLIRDNTFFQAIDLLNKWDKGTHFFIDILYKKIQNLTFNKELRKDFEDGVVPLDDGRIECRLSFDISDTYLIQHFFLALYRIISGKSINFAGDEQYY